MLKRFKYWLLLLTFLSATAQQPDEQVTSNNDLEIIDVISHMNFDNIQNQDLDADNITKLCKEFLIDVAQIEGLEFIVFSIATIVHELGHAIAAKTLFDVRDPIQIHIGTRTPKTIPRLFSLGNMHFYKAMPWSGGLASSIIYIKKNRLNYENIDLGLTTAAGGLSAAAMLYALLSVITGYCAYCDNKKFTEVTFKSIINGTSPFSYILNTKNLSYKQKRFLINATLVVCLTLIAHLFYACTPYRGGDGVRIWRKHMGVTGTPLEIVHVLSTLGVWGCLTLLIKKYCDARKKLSPKDSKIALPAALISLLLMYDRLIPEF